MAGPYLAAMRYSLWPAAAHPWAETLELARGCEAAGWDGVWIADHFMPRGSGGEPVDGDYHECWTMLAALAALVPRLRVGSLVTSVTYRHPAVLANIVATLDRISDGRAVLGVGAGWQANEHASYGLRLGPVKERLDRLEEACEILVGLLRQPRTTFEGRYFQVRDAPCQPTPVQERLPLLIGGGGEQRTLRLVARLADEWNTWSTPEILAHKVDVLRRHCDAFGRDPAEIRVSTQALVLLSDDETWLEANRARVRGRPSIVGTPTQVVEILGRYRDAGLDELIVPDWNMGELSARRDMLNQFWSEVVPQLD